jgi:lipoyl(octanoyl) transferase
MSLVAEKLVVKERGRLDYQFALDAMRDFTARRTELSGDELWVLEHPPVYTLGQGAEDCAVANGIPVLRSDRGGEITYHGPGQVVLYTLVDLARRGIKVKRFVWLLEQAVIDLLDGRGERRPGVVGERRAGAPGVYVEGAKIAALGIRVSRGRAYHGVALNVDMDLAPFSAIDPCGYPGLAVTQTRNLGFSQSPSQMGNQLVKTFMSNLEHA